MSSIFIVLTALTYIAYLLALVYVGDKVPSMKSRWARHPLVYAFALGAYSMSWTFFGLVGTASVNAWDFVSFLLGPVLVLVFASPLLERIFALCRTENIYSVAGFVSARFGKRKGVAFTAAAIVLLAVIPYLSLQLKVVADTFLIMAGNDFLLSQNVVNQYIPLIISLVMILCTLLLGVKYLDTPEYHSGLVFMVAVESFIKIMILLILAIMSGYWISDFSSDGLSSAIASIHSHHMPLLFDHIFSLPRFLVLTFLSMCAFFCLPKMFHLMFVECISTAHLRRSRWLLIACFMVVAVCIAVIAVAGNTLFIDDAGANADAYMIALPLFQQVEWLSVLVFVGGFSAAMAMIVVTTITLSHMLSRDVLFPLFGAKDNVSESVSDTSSLSRTLLFVRYAAVVAIIMAAYAYQYVLPIELSLARIGLLSFALIAQLAPAILLGLYWNKGHSVGFYAGLMAGFVVLLYTLMIPWLVEVDVLDPSILLNGLWSIDGLRPEYVFNLSYSDHFTRSITLSLFANALFFVAFSMLPLATLVDKVQSAIFTSTKNEDVFEEGLEGHEDQYEAIHFDDLKVLLAEFLGEFAAEEIFAQYGGSSDQQSKQILVQQAQKALASVVGVASSELMIKTLYSGKKMAVEEVVNLVGETTKALRFSQEVLSASFENISSGISVVDRDLRLVAWNQHYEEMFNYPKGILYVGLHALDIMRFNAKRGVLGSGDTQKIIQQRLSNIASGTAYKVRRHTEDNVVIEIKGEPLPNGGYVTTYNDVTEYVQIQQNLEDTNANLETRVHDRTQKIEEVNNYLMREIKQRSFVEQELREAKKLADHANASKTKFLALASHDIMQPLNAANLYASALLDINGNIKQDPNVVKQLKSAIQNTELIIGTLLEVSKLDSGVLQPKKTDFDLNSMLTSIIDDVSVQLPEGMSIRYCKTSVSVNSDRHYLHRIVQNFVSNAIKYTIKGKVLLGCRRIKGEDGLPYVKICIYDNGMGVSEQEQASIFGDFYRVDHHKSENLKQQAIPGVGLGLSVVARFSELLQHKVLCRSTLHRGSCFSVTVPLVESSIDANMAINLLPKQSHRQNLEGLVVAYVDDEEQNLLSTSALLDRWQCEIIALDTIAFARDYAQLCVTGMDPIPDVLLMDYQLDEPSISGIDLAKELVASWEAVTGARVPVCVISASDERDLPDRVAAAGFQFLRKPLKPGRLRALLTQINDRRNLSN